MQLTYEVSGMEAVNKGLNVLFKQVTDRRKFFQNCSMILIKDIVNHFEREESPEGNWKPLKYRTGEILRDTGKMFNSILGSVRVTNNDVTVGTPSRISYAPKHQTGQGNIPKRTFIWMSTEAADRIQKELENWIRI